MRLVALVLIKCYWRLIPASARRSCLFKESCSNYVYRIAKKKGLYAGIKALRYRYMHCRSGYTILEVSSQKILVSANHTVFQEKEIHPRLLSNNEPQ